MNSPADALTPLEHGVLAFEKAGRWKFIGAKEALIWDTFKISLTRYFQVLDHAIDKWEAQREYPALVRQLRSVREARRKVRSATAGRPAHPSR